MNYFKKILSSVLVVTFFYANVSAFAALEPPAENALPTGYQPGVGSTSYATSGNIGNFISTGAATTGSWESFNVGSAAVFNAAIEGVHLSRVRGADPSQIFGTMNIQNGKFFLVNPNGVLFGPGSQVNAPALVASALNISDQNFLSNHLIFEAQTIGSGFVRNQGTLTSGPGGYVALLGKAVRNDGQILTPGGSSVLTAGEKISLSIDPRGLVSAVVNTPIQSQVYDLDGNEIRDLVSNYNLIRANGGQVILTARALDELFDSVINHSGVIEAQGTEIRNGRVVLTGNRVGLFGNARIDASGVSGGGEVLIGGDYRGQNPDVFNATRTYVSKDSVIDVSARESGDAGRAIVWAEDITRFNGSVFARGGSVSGDGGFVEVSGKNLLKYKGYADLSSTNGAAGTILFDPLNIVLSFLPDADTVGFAPPPDIIETFGDDPGATSFFDVDPGTSFAGIAGGSTIELHATNNVTINDPFDLATATGTANVNLILRAGNDITVNAALSATGTGSLELSADDNVPDGVGTININAAVTTTNQPITFTGADLNITAPGSLNAGNSRIDLLSSEGTLDVTLGGAGEITDAEFNRITADTLKIKAGAVSGDISVIGVINLSNINNLTLEAIGGISQVGAGTINVDSGAGGLALVFDTNTSLNLVNNIASLAVDGNPGNSFSFRNADGFIISTVDGINGVVVSNGSVSLTADTGNIVLDQIIDTDLGGGSSVSLTATTGDIRDVVDANGTDVQTDSLTMVSATGIGSTAPPGDIDIDATTVANAQTTAAGEIALRKTGAGNITLTNVDSFSGTITINAPVGNITLGTIASDTGVTLPLNDINVTATTGGIVINNSVSSDDLVTLSSNLAIEDNGIDATADILAASVSLTAVTGIGATSSLDLDVNNVAVASSVNGGVTLDLLDANNSGVTVTLADASNAGNVVLTATSGNGLKTYNGVDTNNGSITITAANGNMAITSVMSDTGGGAGNGITITATNGDIALANNSVDMDGGFLTMTANKINGSDDATKEISLNGGMQLNAKEIGGGGQVEIQFINGGGNETLELSSTAAAGEDTNVQILNQNFDEITIEVDDADSDIDVIMPGGDLIDINGAAATSTINNVALASATTFTYSLDDAAASVLINTINTIAAITIEADFGSINDMDDVGNNIATGGALTLEAATSIGNLNGAQGLNTAVASIDATSTGAGNITISENNIVTLDAETSNGDITVTAGGNLSVGAVTAGTGGVAGDISLTSTTQILDEVVANDNVADLIGDSVTLNAATGMGIAANGSLDINANTITANNALADIQLNILNDAVAANGLAANHAVSVTVDASTNGNINLEATTGSGTRTYANIDTNDGNIGITAALGNVILGTLASDTGIAGVADITVTTTAGGIVINNSLTSDDQVNLNSNLAIEDNAADAIADILGASTSLVAQTGIGAASSVDLDVVNVAQANSVSGGVTLDLLDANNSGVQVTASDASNSGNITLTATSGTGTKTYTLLDTNNGDITLSAASGDMVLTNINSDTGVAGTHDISVTSQNGDISVAVVNSDDDVTLTSSSDILDDAAASVITADRLQMTAASNIGAAGAARIDTTVATLNARTTGAGNIFVQETDALILESADAADGIIDILSGNALTIQNVLSRAANAANDVLLRANGGNIIFDNAAEPIISLPKATAGQQVTLDAVAGNIVDGNGDALDVSAHDVLFKVVPAAGTVGTALDPIEVFTDVTTVTDTAGGVIPPGNINVVQKPPVAPDNTVGGLVLENNRPVGGEGLDEYNRSVFETTQQEQLPSEDDTTEEDDPNSTETFSPQAVTEDQAPVDDTGAAAPEVPVTSDTFRPCQ